MIGSKSFDYTSPMLSRCHSCTMEDVVYTHDDPLFNVCTRHLLGSLVQNFFGLVKFPYNRFQGWSWCIFIATNLTTHLLAAPKISLGYSTECLLKGLMPCFHYLHGKL